MLPKNLRYSAIDGYAPYELYKRIAFIRNLLGLDEPILDDKLCIRCHGGYKPYKRHKQAGPSEDTKKIWQKEQYGISPEEDVDRSEKQEDGYKEM